MDKRRCGLLASSTMVPSANLLDGKVAVITGAGGGIGRAAATLFAENGATIIAVDIVDGPNQDTVDAIVDAGGRAVMVNVDVADPAGMEQMMDFAEQEFGRIDVVFNNAGVMLDGDTDAVETDDATIDKTFDINIKGVLYGCRYGIPALRRAGGGSIINTASFVASLGAATPQIAYTASKGAVLSLTRELAVIHARENIRVNALSPGPLRTEMLMSFLNTEEKKQRRLVHVPMGRFGEATEMAQAALFLASAMSSYVTGTNLQVDGGLTAAYVTPE